LRSASRNSATVFASTPALRAVRDVLLAVVFAALRACCWRPRAFPPFLAAAVRLADVERELPDDELEELRALADLVRELAGLLRELADLVPELADLLRELADLVPELAALLRAELDRFDPPPDLPVLRLCAICSPPDPANLWWDSSPESGTISPRKSR
jgi:hypothetical protein